MRWHGLPLKIRSKKACRTPLCAFLLLFSFALTSNYLAMNAPSKETSPEAFSSIFQDQIEEADASKENIPDENADEESTPDESDDEESAPDESADEESTPDESDDIESAPDESDDEESADEESIEPEEIPMTDIPIEEETATLAARNVSDHIDLTIQQDGDGYTFGNNILTIYESGAYRITGGTANAPLPLSIRIEAAASVDLDDVSISSDAAIALAPDIEVSLFISGENSLSSDKEAAISVPKGTLLTIDGSGELTARGGIGAVFSNPMGCAGIGSGVNMAGGAVIIAGGKISAYGGNYSESGGAGIGSGSSRGNGSMATLESIEIRGGTVFAQGGESAAGIGTGAGRNSGETIVDSILISGGTITGSAGNWAADIGTGEAFSSGTSSIGTITITGGTVNATSTAEGGAAIGTGEAYNSSSNTIDLIQISGGDITAAGGPQGAGIGAGKGYNTNSLSRVDRLEILGGILNAQGGTGGAGIGAGLAQNSGGTSSVGQIIINDGTMELRGGLAAACIGSGQGHSRGVSSVDSIVINGGNIQASNAISGYEGGAAIGSGEGFNSGQSMVESLTIRNGTISAAAGKGAAAIGSGEAYNSGISRVDSVAIEGGTISHALGGSSGAGIGSGLTTNSTGTSTVGSIRITGGNINAEGGDSAPGIGTGEPSKWSAVDFLSIFDATVNVYAGKSASAINIETGELNIDNSAAITAVALDQAAISTSMRNLGNGRLVNASFAEDEIDGDFYIRSANLEIRLLLPYPYRHFAFTGLESQYYLIGGYTEQDSLTILDVTDTDNPLNYVLCSSDLAPLILTVAGAPDGHLVEYRANGADGSGPDDPNVYPDGATVTVMGQSGLYWGDLSFTGWNTKPDGSGANYREGDSFIIEDTVTLYSQWSGDAMITKVPEIFFGKNLTLSGRDVLYPSADSDASLTLIFPSPGWKLTASLGGFNDSFGSHDAIPGGYVIFKGGAAESLEGGSPPWVPSNVNIDVGGGAVVIARATSNTDIGSWTFRWLFAEESGIALFVPAGEGSVGSQTATITWTLENVP